VHGRYYDFMEEEIDAATQSVF
jgi:hypothetical protein